MVSTFSTAGSMSDKSRFEYLDEHILIDENDPSSMTVRDLGLMRPPLPISVIKGIPFRQPRRGQLDSERRRSGEDHRAREQQKKPLLPAVDRQKSLWGKPHTEAEQEEYIRSLRNVKPDKPFRIQVS